MHKANKFRATRQVIGELMEACDGCAKVTPTDCGISDEALRKFKYIMGKNYKRLMRICAETEKKISERMESTEALCEKVEAKERALCQELAMVDSEGCIISDDKGAMRFTRENEKKLVEMTQALKEENEPIFEAIVKRNDEAKAEVLAEEVEVELHKMDFRYLPLNVAGSWAFALQPIFSDAPELQDADEDSDAEVIEGTSE